jgi:hypothetical protein
VAALDLEQCGNDLGAALGRGRIVGEQLLEGAEREADEARVAALTDEEEGAQDVLEGQAR